MSRREGKDQRGDAEEQETGNQPQESVASGLEQAEEQSRANDKQNDMHDEQSVSVARAREKARRTE